MLFFLSKFLWIFASPARLFLLLALCAYVIPRQVRLWVGALALATCLSPLALQRLQATFPPLTPPAHVEGIFVLGGAINAQAFDTHPASGFTPAFGRLYEAVRLARAYPQAQVFAIGGPAPPTPQRAEADVAADILVALGVERNRIVRERFSRNTYENAVNTAALVKPRLGAVYVLITSAFHMPRAMGCFRKAGLAPLADPVDYRQVDLLEALDLAAHEYTGLISYYALGRTEVLWPHPASSGEGLAP